MLKSRILFFTHSKNTVGICARESIGDERRGELSLEISMSLVEIERK